MISHVSSELPVIIYLVDFHEPPYASGAALLYASGAAFLSRSRCLLPVLSSISIGHPLGAKFVDQSATCNGCFPLCMRELCVAIVDALVHRSTGHQASLSPGKLGGLSQIPFFALTLPLFVRPKGLFGADYFVARCADGELSCRCLTSQLYWLRESP